MIKVEDICVGNISDAVRVQSPSKVFMEIGANMAEDTLREIEVLSTDEKKNDYRGGKKMINLPAIVSVIMGTVVIYLLVRYTIGLLKNGFNTDFDYVMALVIVGIGVLVIVSMMLLDAKGYINVNESSINTEIVEEATDD